MVEEQINYEYDLIDISWSLEYEISQSAQLLVSENNSVVNHHSVEESTLDSSEVDGIPTGQTMDDIRKRQEIISQFFYQWKQSHPEKKIFNHSLDDFIHVRSISIEEAKEHAAKSWKSTKAIFILDEILEYAKKISITPTKQGNKNQSKFEKMLIMSYQVKEIGLIKLTVGIMRSNKNKIQYGVSAVNDLTITEPLKPKRSDKKRKASRK